MTFDAANQITTMLQGSALTTVTFDNTGNLTVQNTNGALTTFTFDDEDRLAGIASPAGLSTYTSDGDGLRRSAFEAGGVLTTFIWEGSDYLMEKTPSGTQARYAVIEGEVVTEKRSGVRKLYVPDPLGSTRGLIDATQAQTDTFSFWPYGEIQSRTGSTPTPFQFVGTLGYHLDLSGLVYVRARYLDVVRGRWMTVDPAGNPEAGQMRAYGYAVADPAGRVDPSGALPCQGPPPKCKRGKPCCFTCYNDTGPVAHPTAPGCPRCAGPGVCATYCPEYGAPSCAVGSKPKIYCPMCGMPYQDVQCTVCDCGAFSHSHPKARPSCWIDVWAKHCPGGSPQGWLCVEC